MRIVWDAIGERFYKRGLDRGVLYPFNGGAYQTGVPWNGLLSVSPKSDGREKTNLYSDDVRSRFLFTNEEYGGTIKAYMCPDEFVQCTGGKEIGGGLMVYQQEPSPFGLTYRTRIGNDISGTDFGYEICIIYQATVTGLSDDNRTIDKNSEVEAISWDYECIPVTTVYRDEIQFSEIRISTKKYDETIISKIEDILYGTEFDDPRLLEIDELLELLEGSTENVTHGLYPYGKLFPASDLFPIAST